jgi:hypothetical protein
MSLKINFDDIRYDAQLKQMQEQQDVDNESPMYTQTIAALQTRFRKNLLEISHELRMLGQQQEWLCIDILHSYPHTLHLCHYA